MATKPETLLRRSINKKFREIGVRSQPIESPLTGDGIPDNWISGRELHVWIEFKVDLYGKWPCKRAIHFRPGQYRWLKEERDHGGGAFVLVQYYNGYLLLDIYSIDSKTKRPKETSGLFMRVFEAKRAVEWMKNQLS